ncbi:hypothetical protein AHAS_Ahas12G0240000 [Arachis hypogaea]
MQNLVNLRHLDIFGSILVEEMPKKMSKLKDLQFLSHYIVGKHEENGIGELGGLTHLHRSLWITQLENVKNSGEASNARMDEKIHLNALQLSWSLFEESEVCDSQSEKDVLDKLRPHKDLKKLSISCYRAHSKCKGTLYPDLCVSTLSTFPNLETKTMPQIISKVVNHTVHEVKSSSNNCTTIIKNLQNTLNTIEKRALDDCLKLFDDTIVELNTTILDLSKNPSSSSSSNQDLQTLLSGAMTNLYTCLDGFSQSKNGNAVRGLIEEKVIEISHHVSNSLAMLKKVKTSLKKEEVFAEYGTMKKGFPSWVSAKDRKLLEGGNVNETKIDVVVAKDGSGKFTTIGEAVVMAPILLIPAQPGIYYIIKIMLY